MSAYLLDLRSVVLPDNPREWPELPPEQRALLRPANGIYRPDEVKILDNLARRRWFLLRNDGPQGERWRCRYCKGIHPFFTLSCVPVPMNGLTHVLGVMCERIAADDIYSAVALGMVEPLSLAYAGRLYEKLKGLGYRHEQIVGYTPRQHGQW